MSFVDGFELKFLSRVQRAERRRDGRLIDTIPVSWAKSWRQAPIVVPENGAAPPPTKGAKKAAPREAFVEVTCKDPDELKAMKAEKKPFAIALAATKPNGEKAERFGEFRGVFEVAATGVELSPTSLETKVIRRILAHEGS